MAEHGLPPEFPESERFEIDRYLGSGSYGVVYRAYDRRRHAQVALKLLARPDAKELYLFKQEFRALADPRIRTSSRSTSCCSNASTGSSSWSWSRAPISSRHVTRQASGALIASGTGTEATTLAEFSEPTGAPSPAGTRPPESVRGFTTIDLPRLQSSLTQLAQALGYLHASGRLHRDIKPSNMLVSTDGCVKVLDFGLVVELWPDSNEQTLTMRGTPAYMSPEQLRGQPLSEASDWYSVGVMITGRSPACFRSRERCSTPSRPSSRVRPCRRRASCARCRRG